MEDFTLDLNGDSVNAVFYELHFSQAGQSCPDDLNAIRDVCLGMVAPLMEGYIWQREAFQLRTSAEEAPPWRPSRSIGQAISQRSAGTSQQGLGSFRDGSLPCLWGAVQFGDNLEDEWFITWLLQQLTLQIPGAAARVWDNDGEFLLIEAAYSLPRWLKPETSTNRVWLAGGKLHVVPLPSAAVPDIPSFPTLTQALQLVRSEHVPTLAGSEAQGAIQARLRDFQKGRHKHMHRARVIVPARVAALLAAEAQLVAPAVEAFHYRDVDDMRAARRMQHFPAQDMVNVVASFSRCLYAQLEQQQFEPPKGYPLPPPDSPPYRAAHLGMKLTCGFEMLYSRREHNAEGAAGNMDNGANASQGAGTADAGTADTGSAATGQAQALSEEQIADNPSWRAYKSSLERNGYFKDNIPGSQEHRKLMQAALQSFMASEAYKRSTAALAAPVLRMQDILARPIAKERLEEEMQGAEDDDSWMRDGAAELERELAARQAEMDPPAPDKQPGTSFDPEDLAERMKAFVEKESSFEGAELPASAQREGVSLDSKRFWAELGSALGMQPGDRDRSDSEDEGSSFFGGGSDEDDDVSSDAGDDVSREPDEANVYQAQRAERAQNGQAFHKTTKPSSAAGSKPEETSQTVKSQQKQAAGAEKERVAGITTQPPNGASHALQGIKRGFLAGSGGAARSTGKPAAGAPTTAGATRAPHVGASIAAASSTPSAATHPSSGGPAAATTSTAGASTSRAGAADAAASSAARRDEDEQWEVLTATDSDDEAVGDADFMAEYGERMERELGRSKVGATFERTPLQTGASAAEPLVPVRKGKGKAADVEDMGSAPGFVGAPQLAREEEDEDEELQPVDIDLNLVQSLLASYAGQQGLPGPVSNLAGLMGLHLPDDEDSRGKSAFDSFLS